MSDGATKNENEFDPSRDYVARGLATEFTAALRSHERMDELQFKQMTEQHKEIKKLIEDMRTDFSEQVDEVKKEMHYGFARYDNKFWSLAIVTISLLLTITGMLLWKILFPH